MCVNFWAFGRLFRLAARLITALSSVIGLPDGVPWSVEMLDDGGEGEGRRPVSTTPMGWIRLLAMWMVTPRSLFEGRVGRALSSLAVGESVCYVLRRPDGAVLTDRPSLAPARTTRAVRLPSVLSAAVGGADVTRELRAVSLSFSPGACPTPRAMHIYLRHRTGKGIRESPLVLVDGSLQRKEVRLD